MVFVRIKHVSGSRGAQSEVAGEGGGEGVEWLEMGISLAKNHCQQCLTFYQQTARNKPQPASKFKT